MEQQARLVKWNIGVADFNQENKNGVIHNQ